MPMTDEFQKLVTDLNGLLAAIELSIDEQHPLKSEFQRLSRAVIELATRCGIVDVSGSVIEKFVAFKRDYFTKCCVPLLHGKDDGKCMVEPNGLITYQYDSELFFYATPFWDLVDGIPIEWCNMDGETVESGELQPFPITCEPAADIEAFLTICRAQKR